MSQLNLQLSNLLLNESKKGNLKNVVYLIKNGANNLNQALLITESVKVMSYLIKCGANNFNQVLLINSKFGNINIIRYLIKYIYNFSKDTLNEALLMSLRNNNILIFKYLLNYADINTETGFSIRFCAGNGYLQLVKYLVKKNADIRVFNSQPLLLAIQNKHLNVIKYLVQFYNKVDLLEFKKVNKVNF